MAGEVWLDNLVQFPRLLAELHGLVTQRQMEQLEVSMDLDAKDIEELFERAEREWEDIKERVSPKSISSFTGHYRFLSNFYHSKIVLGDMEYPTLEHAFQAAKTTDPVEHEAIRRAATPGKAKTLGRRATLRGDWERKKIGVMRNLLQEKFKDPDLRKWLLETGNRHLEEGNNHGDTFWGTVNGQGGNHLGILLMELRDRLREEDADR